MGTTPAAGQNLCQMRVQSSDEVAEALSAKATLTEYIAASSPRLSGSLPVDRTHSREASGPTAGCAVPYFWAHKSIWRSHSPKAPAAPFGGAEAMGVPG